MAFPTIVVTPGVGQTVNTLPNAGQGTMANSLSVAIASDQSEILVDNQGAVTTAPPTYTTGTMGEISLDCNGQTRVSNPIFSISYNIPTSASTLYAAGKGVGGLLNITQAVPGGVIQYLQLTQTSAQTGTYAIYFFDSNPNGSGTLLTNNSAPTLGAADKPKLIGSAIFANPDAGLGGVTSWNIPNCGIALTSISFYAVLITLAAMTTGSASPSDITLRAQVQY